MQTIKHLGFSLLEMLVTLALVALLSTLAGLTYQHFIARAHRLLATQTLMTAASELERYALTHGSYEGADLHLPENTHLGYRYHANISPTTYTITAEPSDNHTDCLSINDSSGLAM